MAFKSVASRYDGPRLEEQILEFWRERDVFNKTIEQSRDKPRFSFCEGPPTANGKPGIHHVLARTFKDIYPRYKTMRGYYAPRKAGWDTHGLPVEHQVEKELNIFDKKRIEDEVGVDAFTRRCRESVMEYISDWEAMTERMGYWVDMENAYYTLDNDYIESVWWLLHQIWQKDLIYKGYKVVPYDPRIGATLSSHEVAQGYKEVEDPSCYVKFKACDAENEYFLAWTTTPWTLPSNLLLAVAEEMDYAHVEYEGDILIMAVNRVEAVMQERDYRITQKVKGKELIGRAYERLFDYLPIDNDRICKIYNADFVTDEDGTGIVHCTPAYGVDDLELGQRYGIPVLHGVGLDGHFKEEVTPVAGLFFKEADPIILDLLKERQLLLRVEKYVHNYPFGWRTGDPLIYYAKEAWYIRTSTLRERMVELNNGINWVPKTIKTGRFGNWLEHNIDWALSRERFWGTPLPVWTDGENYHMVASLAELEELTGRSLSDVDLHRPAIDEITFDKDGKTWQRVPEVIDCWFDSGAMSYAQWHYPFENKEEFGDHFPADYICEAIDQTRGWFYTLHAIATLISDNVAYKNVVCLSHIVDASGKKMSKSQGNIINPYDVFDTVGVDSLRWYFLARIPPEGQKRISVEIIRDVASSFVNTLWNTYGFFVMYAQVDTDIDVTDTVPLHQRPEIDRWIMALLEKTHRDVSEGLDHYDAQRAGVAIETFVDQLSNWYIRRNRRRFWKSDDIDDKRAAYSTLYEALKTLCGMIAPFMPFIAEEMYANLIKSIDEDAAESVHMSEWPQINSDYRNDALIEEMAVAQQVVYLGRAAREREQIRIRQPLGRILVRVPNTVDKGTVERQQSQIMEELNVKKIELIEQDAEIVQYRVKPNLPVIGKKYGKLIPAIRAAFGEVDGADIARKVAAGEAIIVAVNGEDLTFEANDILLETENAEGFASAETGGYLVALDTELSEELLGEGLAREIIRTIQDARKQHGLQITDRIQLNINGDEDVQRVVQQWQDNIATEVLCSHYSDKAVSGGYEGDGNLGNTQWRITFNKVS